MIEIFSNWIFVWFILFELNIIKYNPFIVILLGTILVLLSNVYLIYIQISLYNIIKLFIINFILKFIPLFIMIYYKQNTISYNDILFTIILCNMYLIVLYMLNTNVYAIYFKLSDNLMFDKHNESFLSKIYDKIYETLIK